MLWGLDSGWNGEGNVGGVKMVIVDRLKGLVRGKRLEETGVSGWKRNGREGERNLYIEIEILR